MPAQERRSILLSLSEIFHTVPIDHEMIVSALEWDSFRDFEDCIQAKCALAIGADYTVTRNEKDFKECGTKCVSAGEICELFSRSIDE